MAGLNWHLLSKAKMPLIRALLSKCETSLRQLTFVFLASHGNLAGNCPIGPINEKANARLGKFQLQHPT